ncbi:MAG: hypothetical protein NZL85_05570, partial [Fimbriimonadales bacterium]|nr:hypothetical protein [Fimbriimonadales bacterium]
EYLGLFMLLPYLTIAPVAQVAFTTLAFRKIAAGEPITLRSLWESLKPRALHLIANQLLAIMALGAILTIISLGYIALTIAVVLGVMMVAAGSPTLAIILMATLLLIITIVALVLAAYATVWFLPLPQIIVLEPNADAISAFSRAYELVRPNLKHAVLSCLAFWGVQAVFMLAVMILSLIVLGIAVGIIAIYADLEQALNRWAFSLNQVYESVSYIAYMLVMPAMYMTSVLLYFDLRYRREGLDIYEVLRQSKE